MIYASIRSEADAIRIGVQTGELPSQILCERRSESLITLQNHRSKRIFCTKEQYNEIYRTTSQTQNSFFPHLN